jgi:hypothetical protein
MTGNSFYKDSMSQNKELNINALNFSTCSQQQQKIVTSLVSIDQLKES